MKCLDIMEFDLKSFSYKTLESSHRLKFSFRCFCLS
jgi:hypothetical protein